MLIDAILKEARPYLAGRIIRDAVLGISLIGIELDNNDIGLSYMLRNHLPAGCSVFGFAQEIVGANAFEVAQLAKEGTDDAQRGVGIAVLAAGTRQLALPDEGKKDACFGVKVDANDVIGMIGLIPPVAERLAHLAKKMVVFDEGISLEGSGRALAEQIQPMEKQDKLLPQCDIVIITGSTFINHSIDHLLEVCKDAKEIILVGASTPMYPGAFRSTNVTVLAGSWWDSLQKKGLFKKISLAGGISHVSGAMIKKAVRVEKL